MKKLLAALILCAAAAAQTVTAGPGGGTYSNGTTTVAETVSGVTAGDLVVAVLKWGNGSGHGSDSSTLSGVSDGTSTFTCLAQGGQATFEMAQVCYLLSANGGNVTYTATFSQTLPNPAEIQVYTAHATSGTWAYDASAINYGLNTTSVTTGNVTTSGSAEFSVFSTKLYNTAANTSAPLMFGATPTEPSWSPTASLDHSYYSTATGTGQGSLTYDAATEWVAVIASFKVSGTVAKPPCTLATLGAGPCDSPITATIGSLSVTGDLACASGTCSVTATSKGVTTSPAPTLPSTPMPTPIPAPTLPTPNPPPSPSLVPISFTLQAQTPPPPARSITFTLLPITSLACGSAAPCLSAAPFGAVMYREGFDSLGNLSGVSIGLPAASCMDLIEPPTAAWMSLPSISVPVALRQSDPVRAH